MYIHACTYVMHDTCLVCLYIAKKVFLLQVVGSKGTDSNLQIGGVLILTPLDALFIYMHRLYVLAMGILYPYTSQGNINIYTCVRVSCMYVYVYVYTYIMNVCMCIDYI